jgi:hypothetical protein
MHRNDAIAPNEGGSMHCGSGSCLHGQAGQLTYPLAARWNEVAAPSTGGWLLQGTSASDSLALQHTDQDANGLPIWTGPTCAGPSGRADWARGRALGGHAGRGAPLKRNTKQHLC